MRFHTERQLSEVGIIYDKLILGIGGGTRYIINDTKNDSDDPTCFAITVKRNEGIDNIKL